MKTPDFWIRPPGLVAAALWPLSLAYGRVAAARMNRPNPARASVPVLCIGNVVAGGQGKTPVAIALAAMLAAEGRRPVFLSRGHGGRIRGPVLVDPTVHTAADVGDEPLLLARAAATIVSRDRPAGAEAAVAQKADVIIMDDGFQNPSLAKNLSLVVTDAGFGIGNGLVLPAGPLRGPLESQLARTSALIVVGEGNEAEGLARSAADRGLPVFRARLEPDPGALSLRGERVIAFAGIGRPQKFFDTLASLGANIVSTHAFPDHHPFTAADTQALVAEARRQQARLITTEKDFARFGQPAAALRSEAIALRVDLIFDQPSAITRFLVDGLQLWV